MTIHVALYGNVNMVRDYCSDCQTYSVVVAGVRACCDKPFEGTPTCTKRMVSPEEERRRPPMAERRRQIKEQDGKCYYCERPFGMLLYRGIRKKRLEVHWDHYVPFAFSQDNSIPNFVAACDVCNRMKSSKLYASLWEAKIDLAAKWSFSGYTEAPDEEQKAS